MTIKSTLVFLSLLAGCLFLMGNANGPAEVQGQDRTGSPLSSGSCGTAGCHSGGSFDPTINIELFRAGEPVIGYEPGESHTIRVTVAESSGTPAEYGFQAVVLNSDNDNAGNFGFPSGGQQLVIFASDVEYMEQSTPSTTNSFTMSWDAPAAGAGDVTIYAAGNAADNNGTSSGDSGAQASLTISEGLLSSTDDLSQLSGFTAFPNPVQDVVNLKVNSLTAESVDIKISDVAGKTIHVEQFDLFQGENVKQVEINHLDNGLYFIYLSSGSEVITETIVKM